MSPVVSAKGNDSDVGIVIYRLVKDALVEESTARALNNAVGVEEVGDAVGVGKRIVGRFPALSDRVADEEYLAVKGVGRKGSAVVKLNECQHSGGVVGREEESYSVLVLAGGDSL